MDTVGNVEWFMSHPHTSTRLSSGFRVSVVVNGKRLVAHERTWDEAVRSLRSQATAPDLFTPTESPR